MGIPATAAGVGGWTVGPVLGRRPAGTARDAVHPGSGARAVLVVVDGRFTGRGLPDPETVARAAVVGSPAVMPMLDAGLLEDGTRWYVTPAAPGPVLDPAAGCSPRRAAATVEAVARALAAVHAAGLVHGLVGPNAVVPAAGRHAGRPVGTTLLLDTGVAALLGDRADDLAVAAGVSLPSDRGRAADVYALGALLLRLVTAAAPAGPALAALPVPLRALLSEMLDEHPSRRPTADAVAVRLAEMREGLLATGPVDLPRSAPASRPTPRTVPTPAVPTPAVPTAGVPSPGVPPRAAPPKAVAAAPLREPALQAVPAPVRAPHTLESPIVAPRIVPAPAPSLWTGPVRVAEPARPGRRRTTRILLLAGGVGLAGLVLGVVTHLPLGHVEGDQAVAAVAAGGGGLTVADAPSSSGTPSASSAAAAPASRARHRSTPVAPSASASAPAFVRPTATVPSPLTSSATSTTPSRNVTAPAAPVASAAPSSSPAAAAPSSPASAHVDPVATTDPSTSAQTQPSSDPAPGTPSSSGSSAPADPTSTAPSETPTSAPTSSGPTSSAPTSTDPTPTDPSSPSDPSSSDSAPSDS